VGDRVFGESISAWRKGFVSAGSAASAFARPESGPPAEPSYKERSEAGLRRLGRRSGGTAGRSPAGHSRSEPGGSERGRMSHR